MLLAAQTMPSSGTGSALSELWPWLIAFVVVVLVGGVVIGAVRKWMRGTDESQQIGFTLGDLRELHREGKLSSEELKLAERGSSRACNRGSPMKPALNLIE